MFSFLDLIYVGFKLFVIPDWDRLMELLIGLYFVQMMVIAKNSFRPCAQEAFQDILLVGHGGSHLFTDTPVYIGSERLR